MNKKKLIIVILVLLVFGVVVLYKIYNKPHVNVAKVKSDISLTADKILNDFSSNEKTANTKYLEKVIEIYGIVSELKVEKEKGIITLKTNDDFGSVLCHLSNESTKRINMIKEGQTITLKGICTGYLMDVILIKCEIKTY